MVEEAIKVDEPRLETRNSCGLRWRLAQELGQGNGRRLFRESFRSGNSRAEPLWPLCHKHLDRDLPVMQTKVQIKE